MQGREQLKVWSVRVSLGFLRIYLSSCQCLYCRHCLPKSIEEGHCLKCQVDNVAVKPLGKELSSKVMDLFKPLKDQPSLDSLAMKQEFKQRHLSRTIALHQNYRENCRSVTAHLKLI